MNEWMFVVVMSPMNVANECRQWMSPMNVANECRQLMSPMNECWNVCRCNVANEFRQCSNVANEWINEWMFECLNGCRSNVANVVMSPMNEWMNEWMNVCRSNSHKESNGAQDWRLPRSHAFVMLSHRDASEIKNSIRAHAYVTV
jgi:hypothetical protein